MKQLDYIENDSLLAENVFLVKILNEDLINWKAAVHFYIVS